MKTTAEILEKTPFFKAKLVRERFTLTPQKKNASEADIKVAVGNRLNFKCYSSANSQSAEFIVRAQNIHTCLRIGARLAQQWYEFGHIKDSGRERFKWDSVYKEAVQEYEEKWNPKVWACIYQNGKIIHETADDKSEFLDIIEQVFAYEKCSYRHIVMTAEKLFQQAGRHVKIDYDSNIAMDLEGTSEGVENRIIHRDVEGRNKLDLIIRQKEMKFARGAKGAKVKLSECMSVAAIIFEGLQLGFIVGQTNYKLKKGLIKLGEQDAVQADHALRRIQRLNTTLEELKNKHDLVMRPKPDFQKNAQDIESSFEAQENA